jgi:large subunit ribosomal protein L4
LWVFRGYGIWGNGLQVTVRDQQGNEVDTTTLLDEVFSVPFNEALVHQVVVGQLANGRQGTHDTLTRAEVRGGGRKPWRQKHTGRARHGSIRSPIWRGGGLAFGPHPRSHKQKLPAKLRLGALRCALSNKLAGERLLLIDSLNLDRPKTREMVGVLSALNVDTTFLTVVDHPDRNVLLATRNIPGGWVKTAKSINVVDVFKYEFLIVSVPAVRTIEKWLSDGE